jgi:outer membrane receptor protein involved in Fe transport
LPAGKECLLYVGHLFLKKACFLLLFSTFVLHFSAMPKHLIKICLSIVICLSALTLQGQNKGVLFGQVIDADKGETLPGVNIYLVGTTIGAATDFDGNYRIDGIKPGEYTVQVTSIGYEKQILTGIVIDASGERRLDISISEASLVFEEAVKIIGEKPLVDIEDPSTSTTISQETIEMAPSRQIQNLLNTQTGVVKNPEGVNIRGGRTYETGFYIDDVSASDPLAGTGFGIDIGTNSIKTVEVTTGGAGVEYGNATAGVVNTKTREGGDAFELDFTYKRDNFGFNSDSRSSFNQQVMELGMGGPLRLIPKKSRDKWKYFTSLKGNFTDEFIQNPADKVTSSLYPDSFWTPYQDNRWSGMFKLDYDINPRQRLGFTYLKSLTINQDFNMLRIITGNDVPFAPGYQFFFQLEPDNANTYTHDTNLQTLRWNHTVSNRFSYKVTASRLYVKLRADANGRPWRPEQVNTEFDPRSIVDFPAQIFNPDDSIAFVLPGPGLSNNGGIATLWHDHFVQEYTLKAQGTVYSEDTRNRLSFGMEIKPQEMQWIDITRPWIGAPIELPDGSFTQSFRLGDVSDVWAVKPLKGALFIADKFKYLGLIADLGLRFEYWAQGSFVDNAIENPDAPIRDEIRQEYLDQTTSILGRRFKARLLPKFSASFPIRENQMMYFNYGHSMVQPHPSWVYTGLDPFFTDRSTLSFLGNPNLNPEVDISYELGLKSQITSNDALNVTAYWKDKYDFITSSSILVEDVTGREVSRTIRINSDYARVRGVEISYIKRIGKWFNGTLSFTYSAATGQSSSSSETLADILTTGNRESTEELPLAWDSPIDLKAFGIFTVNEESGLFGQKWLNHFSLYTEFIYRTGRRYTPYNFQGFEPISGRPIYEIESDPDKRFSEIGSSLFWLNMNFRKWWALKNGTQLAFTVEVTNALDAKNASIINPVTGTAWREGDPVPSEWRDPQFLDPRDPRSFGTPPDNPARFFEQRHVMVGIEVRL